MTLFKTLLQTPQASLLQAMSNIAERKFRLDKVGILSSTTLTYFGELESAEGKWFTFGTKLTAELFIELFGINWPHLVETLNIVLSRDGLSAYADAYITKVGDEYIKGKIARDMLGQSENERIAMALSAFMAKAYEHLNRTAPSNHLISNIINGMMTTLAMMEAAEEDNFHAYEHWLTVVKNRPI